jgi:hypothetical protein
MPLVTPSGGFRAHHCSCARAALARSPRVRPSPALLSWLLGSFCARYVARGRAQVHCRNHYFNPAVLGVPVHWAGGQVNYYVDQGPLSTLVTNAAGHGDGRRCGGLVERGSHGRRHARRHGPLNEDVNGADIQVNASGQIIAPADVTPAATNYPVAVIYDADGSVINAIFGATTSQPDACQNNGVYVWIDNFNTNATFAHGVIILNGLCATSANMLEMMSFELERAFGRILGLDFSRR